MGQAAAVGLAALLLGCAPGAGGERSERSRGVFQVGSGFAIAPGLIATAAHVVEGCSSVVVLGARFRVTGEVVDLDTRLDLALIDAPGAGLAPLPIALEPPAAFRSFTLFGYPGGWPDWTPHRVEGFLKNEPRRGFYPIFTNSGPIHPGMSGGPALDGRGAVVGIITARAAVGVVNNAFIAPVAGLETLRREDPAAARNDRFGPEAARVGRIACRP